MPCEKLPPPSSRKDTLLRAALPLSACCSWLARQGLSLAKLCSADARVVLDEGSSVLDVRWLPRKSHMNAVTDAHGLKKHWPERWRPRPTTCGGGGLFFVDACGRGCPDESATSARQNHMRLVVCGQPIEHA